MKIMTPKRKGLFLDWGANLFLLAFVAFMTFAICYGRQP